VSVGELNRYAFINAKLRSRIGGMLDDQRLENLLRCQSLDELFNQLKDTPYEPLLEIYDQSADIQRLEAWLFARNVRLHLDVAKLTDGIHSQTVLAMTRKLEVENLKSVVRLWFSNTVKHQNIDYRLGYLYQQQIVSPIDWARIANAQTYDQIVETLSRTPYAQSAAAISASRIATEGLFSLETAFDRTWFSMLRSVVAKLPGDDRDLVEAVLDRDSDLKNIINLVRFGWMYSLPGDKLRTLMLEGGGITKTKEFRQYLETPPAERSPQKLVGRRFPDLAKELQESGKSSAEMQTLLVEQYLFRIRRKEFHAMLRGYPFNFGIILTYFFLEERQDTIIRSLINGIHYGWDSPAIREFAV
jgi:vacuolar-type H+-ATPase subunit C/Vma6